MPMEGLKRRLSFRKKKDKVPECSKPHQWQEDEKKVREGNCSFQVRYLGCVEVFESRGMQVCEEAVRTLKLQCKGKYQRAILYVSGDALRVVDEISKSMIVDQTIEKVSFCAPDRNHEKGFAYICRDGTTRRWMCHGFLAVKESRFWRSTKIKGERLSHAVGCAFAICLERKQKRDKESGVTVTYSNDRTTFTRTGSFRQTTLTERITDPQSAIMAEPVPVRKVDNPYAVQRPHATDNMLVRQGSFRGFSKLQEASSPFKRTLSLRLNELPSTLQRQNAVELSPPGGGIDNTANGVIQEVSPERDDSISQMCAQLTQGLSALSTEDPFASAPAPTQGSIHGTHGTPYRQNTVPTFHSNSTNQNVNQFGPPAQEINPWAMGASQKNEAFGYQGAQSSPSTNPFLAGSGQTAPLSNGMPRVPAGSAGNPVSHIQHLRSHSIDTSELSSWHPQPKSKQTLLEMAQHQSFQVNTSESPAFVGAASNNGFASGDNWATSSVTTATTTSQSTNPSGVGEVDPFDIAWAAKSSSQKESATNPFATKQTFEVKL